MSAKPPLRLSFMEWIALAIRGPPTTLKEIMGNLLEGISEFISKALKVVVAGSILTLVAGEVKLAALKKASQGSTKLSAFTQKMTKTKLKF